MRYCAGVFSPSVLQGLLYFDVCVIVSLLLELFPNIVKHDMVSITQVLKLTLGPVELKVYDKSFERKSNLVTSNLSNKIDLWIY